MSRITKLAVALALVAAMNQPAAADDWPPCTGTFAQTCTHDGEQCEVYTNTGGVETCVETSPAAVAVAGSGTIMPGLADIPTYQTVTFTVTLAAGAGARAGRDQLITALGCVFAGGSTYPETELVGQGYGTIGNCTTGSVEGSIGYTRLLNVVTLSGAVTVNGRAYEISTSALWFTPTSFAPSTSYTLHGEVTLS